MLFWHMYNCNLVETVKYAKLFVYGICLVLHIFYKNATAAFSKYSCGIEIHQTSPLFITFCVVVIYALMHTRNYHLSNKKCG